MGEANKFYTYYLIIYCDADLFKCRAFFLTVEEKGESKKTIRIMPL